MCVGRKFGCNVAGCACPFFCVAFGIIGRRGMMVSCTVGTKSSSASVNLSELQRYIGVI